MSKIIFVLGSPNSDDGGLSDISLGRIECAVAIQALLPESVIVATGGFGIHFNSTKTPHRELVHCRLSELGFSLSVGGPDDLLSSNTVEDVLMIAAFATSHGYERYSVVTSKFHLQRCRYIFDCLEVKPVDLYGSNDPLGLDPNIVKHEARALSQLVGQNGVVVDGVLYPHPTLSDRHARGF